MSSPNWKKGGPSPNPGGRPKGIPNSVTTDLRLVVKLFLEKSAPLVMRNFYKMKPAQQNNFWLAAASLVIPKRINADLEVTNVNTFKEWLATLTDDQFHTVLQINAANAQPQIEYNETKKTAIEAPRLEQRAISNEKTN